MDNEADALANAIGGAQPVYERLRNHFLEAVFAASGGSGALDVVR